jgi:hypothetical protein
MNPLSAISNFTLPESTLNIHSSMSCWRSATSKNIKNNLYLASKISFFMKSKELKSHNIMMIRHEVYSDLDGA